VRWGYLPRTCASVRGVRHVAGLVAHGALGAVSVLIHLWQVGAVPVRNAVLRADIDPLDQAIFRLHQRTLDLVPGRHADAGGHHEGDDPPYHLRRSIGDLLGGNPVQDQQLELCGIVCLCRQLFVNVVLYFEKYYFCR
jgi:hypothetical protein